MSEQLTHSSKKFISRQFPLVLVLDAVAAPANIGGLFRLADAFGIEQLLVCGQEINIQSPRLKRTARATVEQVDFQQWKDAAAACQHLKQNGYTLFCLEITNTSVPLDQQRFEGFSKVALIVGNERLGVSQEVLELVDACLHIRMYGENSSMNVTQSAGIALYEITKSLPPMEEK